MRRVFMKSDDTVIGSINIPFFMKISTWIWLTLLIFFLLASVYPFCRIYSCERLLKTGKLKAGIIQLQLAGTAKAAQEILSDWQTDSSPARGIEVTGNTNIQTKLNCGYISIFWDWFLIPTYTLFYVTYFIVFLKKTQIPFAKSQIGLCAIPIFAGLLDVFEDFGLLKIMNRNGLVDDTWPLWTSAAAVGKFALLIGFTFFLAFITGLFLMGRRSRRTQPSLTVDLEKVIETEHKYISFRRSKAGLSDAQPYVGLTSSGGGIRSATVNLGVIQQLLTVNFMRRIDYHCTVSGGGYIGSALASLLSFKESRCIHDTYSHDIYAFSPGDSAHFNIANQNRFPLPCGISGLDNHKPSKISRNMVLEHIRTFGEYLIRKRRIFSRDVLRVIGSLLAGMFGTIGLFALTAFAISFIILLLLAFVVLENDFLFQKLFTFRFPDGFLFFLKQSYINWKNLSFIGIAVGFGTIEIGKFAINFVPQAWFRRDGDTEQEAQQHRILWVIAFCIFAAAFVLPVLFIQPIGFMAPAIFLFGCTSASLVRYIIQSLSSDFIELQNWHFKFTHTNRSYYGSVLGLFLLLSLSALGMCILPWLAFKLGRSGNNNVPYTEMTGLISALVAGLIAWYKKFKGSDISKKLESFPATVKKTQTWLQRFILGVAVFLVFSTFLVLSLGMAAELIHTFASGVLNLLDYLKPLLYTLLGVLLIGYVFDFNRLSLHYFYRDRLAEAYLTTIGNIKGSSKFLETKRNDNEMRVSDLHGTLEYPQNKIPTSAKMVIDQKRFSPSSFLVTIFNALQSTGVSGVLGETVSRWPPMVWLSRYFPILKSTQVLQLMDDAATTAPYNLFSTCLNLTTDRNMILRSRKSDNFIFSKLFCGSDTTGYLDTTYYRSDDTKVAKAMTISGAAADSAIGKGTFFAQSFASTLFNIRLGQWLENPAYRGGMYAHCRENLVFWPKYIFMEALGMSDSRRRLIHLSDGGHTGDNLGLIPLLKRRCDFIIAVDAEADPDYSFTSLNNAIRYAQIDTNTHIEIDVSHIVPNPKTGLSKAPFALGAIEYRNDANQVIGNGSLLVIKSAITKEMSICLHHYRQTNIHFPQEVTVDQFFSEDQFEAYRILGIEIAKIVFDALGVLKKRVPDPIGLMAQYRVWLRKR
jgi:hypothetical protein